MTKHCKKVLPEGAVLEKRVDIQNKKVAILINLLCLLLTVGIAALGLWILSLSFDLHGLLEDVDVIFLLVFFLVLIVYLVLHELTHGVMYVIFTKEKLTFGLSLSCAYCGVKGVYVDKECAIHALLAPFLLYSLVFALGMAFSTSLIWKAFFLLLFSVHFGGCSGDLYEFFLYLFCFHRKNIWMMDYGAKQEFYLLP